MIKKYRVQLIISSIIILLPIVIGLLIRSYLPEQIVTYWNPDGESHLWSSRNFAIFGVPILLFVVHWICVFLVMRDPQNKDQNSKVFNMVFWLTPITSLIVSSIIYAVALGNDISIGMIVRILLGCMFMIMGNYMPKCKPNQTIGVRVKWALHNKENWNKTNRFTGRLWVLGGVIFLATAFVSGNNIMYVFLVLILFLAFAPMIYSYLCYRKQLAAGTATKEDAEQTSFEKKSSKIGAIVGIVIVALAAIFLVSGKFEVMFDETSFTIEAAYWDDATDNYEDIEEIEYREQVDRGSRTLGYGTPWLVIGQCENSEFGKYTGYMHTSCDDYVVLKGDGKLLVVNGKDEEDTKAIYEELLDKMRE